jgi:bacillithiol system protein YtxJ
MAQISEISTLEEWTKLLEHSQEKAFWVFKHSDTCPISKAAWKEFQAFVGEKSANETEFYMVEVKQARPVSNQIAEDLALKHESPQAILVGDKEMKWNASHGSITKGRLEEVSSK